MQPDITYTIPSTINELSSLEAVQYYVSQLSWAVHPLCPPDQGEENGRGKKPLLKGWTSHTVSQATSEFLAEHFGGNSHNNIGCVVRPPFIHVDLDSKPDAGASVQEWLAGQPELATVPRERTGGGVHLAFICRDVPGDVLVSKKAPTCHINDKVSAELYLDGLNLVLSPSVHRSGHVYRWEVMGEIPEVSWADLCRWFGFGRKESKTAEGPTKSRLWWMDWKEDLRTLDLVGVMGDLDYLGDSLDPDTGKWSVRCPWESEHSNAALASPKAETVIFNSPGKLPGFSCLHAHCADRKTKDIVEWAEMLMPGIIAAHCERLRVTKPPTVDNDGKPEIELPRPGLSQSMFGEWLGKAIAPMNDIFLHGNSVVQIGRVPVMASTGVTFGYSLTKISAAEFITSVERTVKVGITKKTSSGDIVFTAHSMDEKIARITLAGEFFKSCLPVIHRILNVPTPHFHDGEIVYPNTGFDGRFGTWLSPNAPKIKAMGLSDAISLLMTEIFNSPEQGGFHWRSEQDKTHALARFITPFCRGLMEWRRSPLWIFEGNRPSCGKDTCADTTQVLYTGVSLIVSPLSKDSDEEMRKRITSFLIDGSQFFHLSNMKGHICSAALEAATDNSGSWGDRILGVSQSVSLVNEMEFSLSANNATWEPDIERRSRRIRLFFTPDDINSHQYRHTDILGWIRKRRSELLSAVAALVNEWARQGCPPGPTMFTSFPQWGRVVGGIFMACGLPNPCLPHEENNVSGDQSTQSMREFFVLAHKEFGNDVVSKPNFQQFIQTTEAVQDLFDWVDFKDRRGLVSFGKLIRKYDGRELGGITLHIKKTSKNCASYQFASAIRETDDVPVSGTRNPTPGQGGREEQGVYGVVCRSEELDDSTDKENDDPEVRPGRQFFPEVPVSLPPVLCTQLSDLDRIAADLADAPRIALDIETYGGCKGDRLDPWKGDIRLLTVRRRRGTIWCIDLRAIGYDLGPLKPVLEAAEIIAHNAKFDLLWLRVKCGLVVPKVCCTLTAARLLSAGTKPGNNLDQCLERFLGIKPATDLSLSDWGSMFITGDQLAYAARDVAHLHDLLRVLEDRLDTAELDVVWMFECAILPCVVNMEEVGIRADRQTLDTIAGEARRLVERATDDLRTALGSPALNPASVPQLLAALCQHGLAIESTNEETLMAANDNHLVPLVLAYREASKREQQAVALIKQIQSDGRIHGRFEPMGADTGRFTSKNPNLQSIARGEIREAFTAPDGRRLIVADYSQIELRAAAAIAGEPRMIEAYRAGADLHRLTAAAVLKKQECDVTKEDRQLAKAVNFGLLYGQYSAGLVRYAAASYGVTMDEAQAGVIREAFFNNYTHLRKWHSRAWYRANNGLTEVRTITGRRRLIPEDAQDWQRFTAYVNTPVQGGTAEVMKLAIYLVDDSLPEGAFIVSTVHDELIVECPEQDAEAVRKIVVDSMTLAMDVFFRQVPVEVELRICKNWGEK